MVERELLGGIKEQLLNPAVVKAMSREIRKQAKAPKRDYKAEIRKFDKQIENIVDSLVAVGSSPALTSKLRVLEEHREELASIQPATTELVTGAAEKWVEVASNLENLCDIAKPDEMATARKLVQEIIGETEIKETTDGVFAFARLNTTSGDKAGAQKRT